MPDSSSPAPQGANRRRRGRSRPRGPGRDAPALVVDPQRLERRRASVPQIRYPDELPISPRRDDLLAAVRDHQVVIVAGETGSGKSTQLPKLCLELGRGIEGWIGHTQPRRVAARAVAERVADELGSHVGAAVGYTVRFNDRVGEDTLVKVMTDGILLAEIQRDRLLRRYDTLIIDEAHERSLNVDFLLGYLKQLLPDRPDLKVIVTSATIDTERFSAHFADAPVIQVSGRGYPVEMRYRPFDGPDDDRDQVQAVCDAIDELCDDGPGDILVFLSGEREIHDVADALAATPRADVEVLPLYARLSSSEQHRIFAAHRGRRIVLSTNVAETSLTVPGVRSVVDAGTARISRYSVRSKVQRLPIEPISQASANQRAGRCGRTGPGVCIRLFSEEDFAARPLFTEPEILRTNLASVILQMTAARLGDIEVFPFLDPPDARAIRDGVALLEELSALEVDPDTGVRRLTPLGRRLAQLPIDPRLARMVIEADRLGCAREVIIIAAALSIQDPRERPSEHQQAADELHRRFNTDGSDFLAFVRMWDHLRREQRSMSSNQFRKLCRREFLHDLRVREWQDLVRQLRSAAAAAGIHGGADAGHPDRVHQAVLSGLLSHIGMRDGESREYRGARTTRFAIARRSSVGRASPRWVMAAELVETNRLWARVVGPIQPQWAEQLGAALVKRSYGEPRWDARRGSAVSSERVTLYGLPIVAARTVAHHRIDPVAARTMFIHHVLVLGTVDDAAEIGDAWRRRHPFLADNAQLIGRVRRLGERSRRWLEVSEEDVFAFYDARLSASAMSTEHFDRWWRRSEPADREQLRMTMDAFGSVVADDDAFPDIWRHGALDLRLSYRFDPGAADDGVTVHIPLALLNQIEPGEFEWHVPGMRADVIDALVRTVPKALRRSLSPLAQTVQRAVELVDPTRGSLRDELARVLAEISGERVSPADIDPTALGAHARVGFSIDDDNGRTLFAGKDFAALRARAGGRARAAIAEAAPEIERHGMTSWDIDELPTEIAVQRAGNTVRGFPSLIDDGDSVSVRVFSSAAIQGKAMPTGVRRLLQLQAPIAVKPLQRLVGNDVRLALGRLSTAQLSIVDAVDWSLEALINDCCLAVHEEMVVEAGAVWTRDQFAELLSVARHHGAARAAHVVRAIGPILIDAARLTSALERLVTPPLAPSVADAQRHLGRLMRPGFVARAGPARLDDLHRYVRALDRRLAKLPENPRHDRQMVDEIAPLEDRYAASVAALRPSEITTEVLDLRWTLEELRVSLFAPAIGARGKVSPTRLRRELASIAVGAGV